MTVTVKQPEVDIAAKIATLMNTFVVGTNLFTGPMRIEGAGVPKLSMFVIQMPGGSIENYIQGGSRTNELYTGSVRIIVRSDSNAYAAGLAAIREAGHELHDVDVTGYIACRLRTSEPMYFGVDDDGAHLFGFDVDVIYSV